jgi:hypothetical protein
VKPDSFAPPLLAARYARFALREPVFAVDVHRRIGWSAT